MLTVTNTQDRDPRIDHIVWQGRRIEIIDAVRPTRQDKGFGGEGQHPIVCAQNEGFIIRNANSFPAGMTWAFSVNCVWAEAAAF